MTFEKSAIVSNSVTTWVCVFVLFTNTIISVRILLAFTWQFLKCWKMQQPFLPEIQSCTQKQTNIQTIVPGETQGH